MNIAERIYQQIKQDIFDFQLSPGDRFSESEIARKMSASRTPVREALYRLERDGYVQVHFRSGWQVRPFDFRYFENLYDVRILLEEEAVRRLTLATDRHKALEGLMTIWCCKPEQRLTDSEDLAFLDEEFHYALVEAAGNDEMTAIHHSICERLRIIRRLDFTQAGRIEATYDEHADILGKISDGNYMDVVSDLRRHIEISKDTVRDITLHRIQCAKSKYAEELHMNMHPKNS